MADNFNIQDKAIVQSSGIIGTGGTPTLSMGSAAGSGASANIIGTNLGGKITLTTGLNLLSTGSVMTMTFANGFAYPTGCVIFFSAGDANFASVLTKLSATTTPNGVTLSTTLALSVTTTYIGYYQLIGW